MSVMQDTKQECTKTLHKETKQINIVKGTVEYSQQRADFDWILFYALRKM